MTIRQLQKTEWRGYFDRLYKRRFGAYAAIEIDSRELGAQIQATAAFLEGAVYDPKTDLLELVFEGLDHLIHRPTELYVDELVDEPLSLAVRNSEGALQIYVFRALLMLPPPSNRYD